MGTNMLIVRDKENRPDSIFLVQSQLQLSLVRVVSAHGIQDQAHYLAIKSERAANIIRIHNVHLPEGMCLGALKWL